MKFNPKRRTSKIILLISVFIFVSLVLWNTNIFFEKFKHEERLKIENWAAAQAELLNSSVDQELGNLPVQILRNNDGTRIHHLMLYLPVYIQQFVRGHGEGPN